MEKELVHLEKRKNLTNQYYHEKFTLFTVFSNQKIIFELDENPFRFDQHLYLYVEEKSIYVE